jgi:hypothetical protein
LLGVERPGSYPVATSIDFDRVGVREVATPAEWLEYPLHLSVE